MPNWTFNTITAPKKILSKYLSEGGKNFDFNKLIPMPESLNVTAGGENDGDIVVFLTEKMTKTLSELSDIEKAILKALVNNMFSSNWQEEVFSRLVNDKPKPDALDEMYERGKVLVDNYKNYGAMHWYDWCNRNWGTKWNACETWVEMGIENLEDDDEMSIQFNTAWSAPFPIFEKMMDDNPGVYIQFEWWDEDYDGNHILTRNADGSIDEECYMEEEIYD